LEIAEETNRTDLGLLYLPFASSTVKVAEGWWISEEAMIRHLAQCEPDFSAADFLPPAEGSAVAKQAQLSSSGAAENDPLGYYEDRIGIAIDPETGTTMEQMLVATSQFRPAAYSELAVGVRVDHPLEELVPVGARFSAALGGEGKQIEVSVRRGRPIEASSLAEDIDSSGRFRLVLLQPAIFDEGWIPDGLQPEERASVVTWTGELNQINCRVLSVCVGKPVRIGGWDLSRNAPRPMHTIVTEGSVYFCETEAPGEIVVEKLHDKAIGQFTSIGYGHSLVGRWDGCIPKKDYS
jgi:CRISPR-associated protein Cmr3